MQLDHAQGMPQRNATVPDTALASQSCRVHDSRWRAHSSTKPACQAPSLTSAVILNSWAAASWNTANQAGNPMLSAQVRTMLKSLWEPCHPAGYPKERSSAADIQADRGASVTPKHA